MLQINDTRVIRPLSIFHQRWLFILIPGFKSYAYDIFTQKHIIFAGASINAATGQNTTDLKAIVVNEKDLFVFNCSGRRKGHLTDDLAYMDLHTLACWKRIQLKGDVRP